MEKALLSVKEFCEYLGIGQTKARELLLSPSCNFKIRIGNRLYAHKKTYWTSGCKSKQGDDSPHEAMPWQSYI